MEAPQNFRSAFNGFHREDVVNYISYISTKHESELNELRAEIEELRARLVESEDAVLAADALRAELAESREKCASLEDALDVRCRDVAVARDAYSELEQSVARQISDLEAASGEKDAEIARLNEELELSRASLAAAPRGEKMTRWTEELNAYRRAESCERRARERVNQMYDQANGALAEASIRVEQTAGQIAQLAAKVESEVSLLLKAMADGENTLADTAVTLGAIRLETD